MALSGLGSFSLSAYDAQSQLVTTAAAELHFVDDTKPLPGEIIAYPPTPAVFLGASHAKGIARIAIHSNALMFELDDFQYGQLVPEPSPGALLVCGLIFVSATRWLVR
jgi:hypothetical protein